jgi:hypothetical protein
VRPNTPLKQCVNEKAAQPERKIARWRDSLRPRAVRRKRSVPTIALQISFLFVGAELEQTNDKFDIA